MIFLLGSVKMLEASPSGSFKKSLKSGLVIWRQPRASVSCEYAFSRVRVSIFQCLSTSWWICVCKEITALRRKITIRIGPYIKFFQWLGQYRDMVQIAIPPYILTQCYRDNAIRTKGSRKKSFFKL